MKTLNEYLKRSWGLGYSRSKHKRHYIKVGTAFGIDPKRVFSLAHGARSMNSQEFYAKQELKHISIICCL